MNISVIGVGYVGLVCGAGFAEMGNTVVCVDIDGKKIEMLKNGKIPIYEPGLEEMVCENIAAGTLTFTTDMKAALTQTNICFIAVGTPMSEDGSADIDHVLAVAASIGKYMEHHMYVIDKSTVPVGTADVVRGRIKSELDKRGIILDFDVVSNPEFLKEGFAVADFMKPDRVVVGVDNERALEVMKELYSPFTRNHNNIIVMDIRSAEMTKYVANAFLACKISFMNEMSGICEILDADINAVRVGVGSDTRIGYQFLYPGCGYGGSCFPKDVRALIQTSIAHDYEPSLLQAVESVNTKQKLVIVDKVIRRFGDDLSGKLFAVWGLSFKPGTDDIRESPSVTIINRLLDLGASVRAFDPKAMTTAKKHCFCDHKSIAFCAAKYEAVQDADALLLLTEWKEFRSPDFAELREQLRQPVIFDGRNQYDRKKLAEMGFEYYQIGVR